MNLISFEEIITIFTQLINNHRINTGGIINCFDQRILTSNSNLSLSGRLVIINDINSLYLFTTCSMTLLLLDLVDLS